jgi:hypothetical protein
MARRFLDSIRADIASQLADNVTGNITAPVMQNLLLDMIDSTIQDEAAIASNAISLAVPTAIDWTSLAVGVYDITVGGDATFLKLDAVNGTVTTSATAGFTYEFEGKISFSDIGSNTPIDFSILADGVQVGFIAAMTGGGGTRARTSAFSHISLSATPNAVYTIGVRTPNSINALDILSVGITAIITPTNNP